MEKDQGREKTREARLRFFGSGRSGNSQLQGGNSQLQPSPERSDGNSQLQPSSERSDGNSHLQPSSERCTKVSSDVESTKPVGIEEPSSVDRSNDDSQVALLGSPIADPAMLLRNMVSQFFSASTPKTQGTPAQFPFPVVICFQSPPATPNFQLDMSKFQFGTPQCDSPIQADSMNVQSRSSNLQSGILNPQSPVNNVSQAANGIGSSHNTNSALHSEVSVVDGSEIPGVVEGTEGNDRARSATPQWLRDILERRSPTPDWLKLSPDRQSPSMRNTKRKPSPSPEPGQRKRVHDPGSSQRRHSPSPGLSQRQRRSPSPGPSQRQRRSPSPGPSQRQRRSPSPGPSQRQRRSPSPGPSQRQRRSPSPGPSQRQRRSPPGPSQRRRRSPSPGPSQRRRRSPSPGPSRRRRSPLRYSPPLFKNYPRRSTSMSPPRNKTSVSFRKSASASPTSVRRRALAVSSRGGDSGESDIEATPEPKKRGRPKGSKNKKAVTKKGVMCSICFDDKRSFVSTSCGHIFHEKCLKHWMREKKEEASFMKTCPVCQKKYTQYFNIFL